MDLSIITVSFNTQDLLAACIASIKKHTRNINYEIIVIDNASKDKSVQIAQKLGAKVIKNRTNVGFAKANNQGIENAKGKYILFLNSDTEIQNNVLGEMVEYMRGNPKVGVATSALKNKDGSIQATGGYFPSLLTVFSWMTIQDLPLVDKFIKPFHPLHSKSFFARGDEFYTARRELDWVTGAFLFTRKDILQKAGGWDETFFMYVEEVDLCYRIKQAGYKVEYLPKWSIVHLGGASSKTAEFPLLHEYMGIKRFYKKHYPSWQYPILRVILKIGALGRMIVLGILEGAATAKIYAKAFKTA